MCDAPEFFKAFQAKQGGEQETLKSLQHKLRISFTVGGGYFKATRDEGPRISAVMGIHVHHGPRRFGNQRLTVTTDLYKERHKSGTHVARIVQAKPAKVVIKSRNKIPRVHCFGDSCKPWSRSVCGITFIRIRV